MEPSNVQRIIFESGIAALCNIAVKYPTIPGISQPVASAFQLLSSHQPYRVSLASEGEYSCMIYSKSKSREIPFVTMKSNNRERDGHCFTAIELRRYFYTATFVTRSVQSSLRTRKSSSNYSTRTHHDTHFHVQWKWLHAFQCRRVSSRE